MCKLWVRKKGGHIPSLAWKLFKKIPRAAWTNQSCIEGCKIFCIGKYSRYKWDVRVKSIGCKAISSGPQGARVCASEEGKLFKYVLLGQIQTQIWLANRILPKLEILFTPLTPHNVVLWSIPFIWSFLPRVCIHFHPYLAFTLVVCDTEQPNLPSSIFMTSDIGPGLHLLHDLVKTTFGKVHKNSLQLSLLIVCAKFAQFSIDKLTRSVHLWGSSVSTSLSIAGSCV